MTGPERLAPLRAVAAPPFAWGAAPGAGCVHGAGAAQHALGGLATALPVGVPWVSLRGPLDLAGGGAAWFQITTPGNPDPGPLAEATDAIWEFVDEYLAPGARVVPIGFSQGGLMATQLLRTRPERVAATAVLGGFVQGAAQAADEKLAASRPAVFWGRGALDRVIAEHAVQRTADWLPGHATVTERVYPGLAHGINAAEVDDLRGFLAEHLT